MEGKKTAKTGREAPKKKDPTMVPLSTVVNFVALFVLFTGILLLQHYGKQLRSESRAESIAADVEEKAVVEKKPAAAKGPKFKNKIATNRFPRDEKTIDVDEVSLPEAEKPQTVLKRASDDNLKPSRTWSPAGEQEISVELLDNENSRQHYLAANRGLARPEAAPIMSPPSRDFIPFEKR